MTTTSTPVTTPVPTCDGDHWIRTSDGRFMWSTEDECIVHGVNAEIGLS